MTAAAPDPTAEENVAPGTDGKNGSDPTKDDATVPSTPEKPKAAEENDDPVKGPVLTRSGRKRPPYKYDPDKVTLRFVFANRDGLAVTVQCEPSSTIGEVKATLLSVWPDDLPECTEGDQLRLICMGKGMLMPDSRTLQDCEVPVFKTHPTPINVSVKPILTKPAAEKKSSSRGGSAGGSGSAGSRSGRPGSGSSGPSGESVDQGCTCVIL